MLKFKIALKIKSDKYSEKKIIKGNNTVYVFNLRTKLLKYQIITFVVQQLF